MTRQLIRQRVVYVDARNCMLVALERAAASGKAQVLCRHEGDGRLAVFDLDAAPPSDPRNGFSHLLTVNQNGEVHAP